MRKTYKLYIGGQFPRSESGRSYVVRARRRHAARQRRARLAQGRPRRRPGRARRVRRLGRQDRDEPRPGPVSRGRAAWRGGASSSSTRSPPPRACARDGAAAQVDRSIDRWVWYAGWADKISQVLGTVNPVRRDYFDFTHPRGDRRRRRRRARGVVAARPRLAARAGRRRRQHRGRARVGGAAAAGGDARRGPGHERRARRRHQHHHRLQRELVPVARRAHGRQRARPVGRAARHARPRSRRRRSRT